jgi:glutaredoxin
MKPNKDCPHCKAQEQTIWHYSANYGSQKVIAASPEAALLNHPFFNREDIKLFAFPVDTSAHKPITR